HLEAAPPGHHRLAHPGVFLLRPGRRGQQEDERGAEETATQHGWTPFGESPCPTDPGCRREGAVSPRASLVAAEQDGERHSCLVRAQGFSPRRFNSAAAQARTSSFCDFNAASRAFRTRSGAVALRAT